MGNKGVGASTQPAQHGSLSPHGDLLTNGKVLVVGGINVINPCRTNTAVAELYDPATGQWTATGTPSTPRANHVAVRLTNGKVLIASGNGSPFSQTLRSAEIYDPDTGTWSPAGSLDVARQSPKATVLNDGRVLVVGGSASASAEVYDPNEQFLEPDGTDEFRSLDSYSNFADERQGAGCRRQQHQDDTSQRRTV